MSTMISNLATWLGETPGGAGEAASGGRQRAGSMPKECLTRQCPWMAGDWGQAAGGREAGRAGRQAGKQKGPGTMWCPGPIATKSLQLQAAEERAQGLEDPGDVAADRAEERVKHVVYSESLGLVAHP